MMQTTNHAELPSTEPLKFKEGVRETRTPGRKLSKDDIASTSVLIRGCSSQGCCHQLPDILYGF